MAGRYQGSHIFNDGVGHRSIEVFWQDSGWFWRARQKHGFAVGPFITSSEAYQNAKEASGSQAFPPCGDSSLCIAERSPPLSGAATSLFIADDTD